MQHFCFDRHIKAKDISVKLKYCSGIQILLHSVILRLHL